MKDKKNLSAREAAALLNVPLVTVQRWIHQGKIPCKIKRNNYYFKRSELENWGRAHDISIAPEQARESRQVKEESHILSRAIARGGVFYNLPGDDIYTVLKNSIEKIAFPENTDKNLVLDELLNREEIASTGIGKSVAIPHPRHILELNLTDPIMPMFFLDQEVDFNSVDGLPVLVLFFMFSPSTDVHLKLLSRLSFCLRDNGFLSLLQQETAAADLINKIKEIERNFDAN